MDTIQALLGAEGATLLAVALIAGLLARLLKPLRKIPKGAIPWIAVGVAVAAFVLEAYLDGTRGAGLARAALEGVLAGALAVSGHEGLKPLARLILARFVGLKTATKIVELVFGMSKSRRQIVDRIKAARVDSLDAQDDDESDDGDDEPPESGDAGKGATSAGIVFVFLALLVLPGCPPSALQAEAVAADSVAKVTNAAIPELAAVEKAEGDRVIDNAGTLEGAQDGLAKVRDRWAPIWAALRAVRAAQDAWATALEDGAPTLALAAKLRDAYCLLRLVAPDGVTMPDHPLLACEK